MTGDVGIDPAGDPAVRGAALPERVRAMVEAFLADADRAARGLIEGFYLEGSLALGDFRPHASDIDFVAVTARRPDAAALDALAGVHGRLRARTPRPFFDGIYVTWDDLAANPSEIAPGPSSHESHFTASSRGQRNPVTWRTLAQGGIVWRGPALADVALWQDAAALAAWTDQNLEDYWRRLLARYRRILSPGGWVSLGEWACAWSVLGVSRLHYTLATGRICAKAAAGRYALRAFAPPHSALWGPLWATQGERLIDEALRIHRAEPRPSRYRLPLLRRRDLLIFLDRVIADGHRVYAARRCDRSG